jgi:nucleoside-diphosphate-sugar epimerase
MRNQPKLVPPMIVGKGLLASAFDPLTVKRCNATIFASGVSNSAETRPECFAREASLLEEYLARHESLFVYFSTCSVADPDRSSTRYVQHKLAMEAKVMANAERHLILRLPQVVGHTHNPHTLTNFLARNILDNEEFPVWESAVRCLIDVNDAAKITEHLIAHNADTIGVAELAPPETIEMDELVKIMETVLRTKARCKRLPLGGGATPDPTLASSIGSIVGIDFSPGYTFRLIQKYYGSPHAN